MRSLRWLGAALAYAALAAFLGYFSQYPEFALRQPHEALIKLSVSHQGELRFDCRQRSAEELADMPENMRSAQDCPRERWPVAVSLRVDGESLFESVIQPAGLANDGTSYVYRRLHVPSGHHAMTLSVRDSGEDGARARRHTREITLSPGQVVVVEYVNGRFAFVHEG